VRTIVEHREHDGFRVAHLNFGNSASQLNENRSDVARELLCKSRNIDAADFGEGFTVISVGEPAEVAHLGQADKSEDCDANLRCFRGVEAERDEAAIDNDGCAVIGDEGGDDVVASAPALRIVELEDLVGKECARSSRSVVKSIGAVCERSRTVRLKSLRSLRRSSCQTPRVAMRRTPATTMRWNANHAGRNRNRYIDP
jgi:hypothetical protein